MLHRGISAQTVKLGIYFRSWICHLRFSHLDKLLNQLWGSVSSSAK